MKIDTIFVRFENSAGKLCFRMHTIKNDDRTSYRLQFTFMTGGVIALEIDPIFSRIWKNKFV